MLVIHSLKSGSSRCCCCCILSVPCQLTLRTYVSMHRAGHHMRSQSLTSPLNHMDDLPPVRRLASTASIAEERLCLRSVQLMVRLWEIKGVSERVTKGKHCLIDHLLTVLANAERWWHLLEQQPSDEETYRWHALLNGCSAICYMLVSLSTRIRSGSNRCAQSPGHACILGGLCDGTHQ